LLLPQPDLALLQGKNALLENSHAFHLADAVFHTTLIEASNNRDLIDAYHNIIYRLRS